MGNAEPTRSRLRSSASTTPTPGGCSATPAPGSEAAQAERIVATAEGNPLFAEHLAALVGDEAAAAGLPRSLQVLLAARLEALPDPEREVVGVAAVAGRDFPVAAVEALVGRAVDGELDRLAQRELHRSGLDRAGSGSATRSFRMRRMSLLPKAAPQRAPCPPRDLARRRRSG